MLVCIVNSAWTLNHHIPSPPHTRMHRVYSEQQSLLTVCDEGFQSKRVGGYIVKPGPVYGSREAMRP